MVPSEISGSAGSTGPRSTQGVSARRWTNCFCGPFLTEEANPGHAGVKRMAQSQQENTSEAKTELRAKDGRQNIQQKLPFDKKRVYSTERICKAVLVTETSSCGCLFVVCCGCCNQGGSLKQASEAPLDDQSVSVKV